MRWVTGLPISEFSIKLRSVSLNKQSNCLSSGKCVTDRDKRIAGHLPLAIEPSAWRGWVHRGFYSRMDLFCQRKDTVLCAWAGTVLEQATDLHFSGAEDTVLSVVCCTKKLHLFFLFLVDGPAGRKTEAKNSWEEHARKATHLLSENIYKYNCHCCFIRMFLLYL